MIPMGRGEWWEELVKVGFRAGDQCIGQSSSVFVFVFFLIPHMMNSYLVLSPYCLRRTVKCHMPVTSLLLLAHSTEV